MKAKITNVAFQKEYDGKFGKMYLFKVGYDGKTALYSSKSKDQKKFIAGQEAEFTEETRSGKNGEYLVIKPIYVGGNSNFTRQLKREQSKYSGFAMSYAKDLVIADKVSTDQMFALADKMFNWMVEKDKTIAQ